jgi:hypothetical protein
MTFPPPTFFPREISVGAFSGVENTKMRESSPEMPKTGSPLANTQIGVAFTLRTTIGPVSAKKRIPPQKGSGSIFSRIWV